MIVIQHLRRLSFLNSVAAFIVIFSANALHALDHSKMVMAPMPPQKGENFVKMPMVREKRNYTVTGNENFDEVAGFGKNDSMAGMMNLMMIEGSGTENMKMSPMKESDSDSIPLEIAAAGNQSEGRVQSHARAQVQSRSHAHAGTGDQNEKSSKLSINAKLSKKEPTVGVNKILLEVRDHSGHPRLGQKFNVSVSMASMDMGTTNPEVKELGQGKYTVDATFSMQGPWKLILTTQTPSGEDPRTETFTYDVK